MDEQASATALRDSEELHRITLRNMSDAVFITDDAGAFTYICPNVDVIFGHDHEDVRRMAGIAELLGHDPVDRATLQSSGEIQNIEQEITTRLGARRTLLVHAKQVAIKEGTTLYVCRDITERKAAEVALRGNEQRLKLALEAASMGIWDWDLPTGEISWCQEAARILGDPSGARRPSFDDFLALVHPTDRERVERTMTEAVEVGGSYETEFRLVGYDDMERWVFGKGRALRNGKPLRMLGVFVDFTERHRLEDELRELSGRLIHAHEQERTRIARELHDDVAQRLALLALELRTLANQVEPAATGTVERVAELARNAAAIGTDLRRVSHELHPATLEQVGLATAIRAFCRELASTRQLGIAVDVQGIPHPLPTELALCLYRITQEALHNVVRHSGATSATVSLSATDRELLLSVADTGSGFDTRAHRDRGTLGLSSMQERVRLVRGQLVVHTALGAGTRIDARVPLPLAE